MITNYEYIIREQTVGEIGLAPKKASKLSSEIWESYRRVYPVSYTHWVVIPAIFTEMYRNR